MPGAASMARTVAPSRGHQGRAAGARGHVEAALARCQAKGGDGGLRETVGQGLEDGLVSVGMLAP